METAREKPPILVTDLDTPVVTIDLDRVERNIARVQDLISRSGRANRPHVKTHKIPTIAAMQMTGWRRRDHLPEARRGGRVHRRRRLRRHSDHLQYSRRSQNRAPDGLGVARQAPRRRCRQRDCARGASAPRRGGPATTFQCSSSATPASAATACRRLTRALDLARLAEKLPQPPLRGPHGVSRTPPRGRSISSPRAIELFDGGRASRCRCCLVAERRR